MTDLTGESSTSFGLLGSELHKRLISPKGQVTFYVYLVIGILVCGGAPIWVELVRFKIGATLNAENIRTAINCYFPAIGCAAAVQLAFAADFKQKYLSSFGMFAAFFFFIASLLTLVLEGKCVTVVDGIVGTALCVLAVLMWWIANGLDRTLQDIVDSEAPLGGPPENPLAGDTSDYST